MVRELTQIDEGVFDLMLTDVHNLVQARVRSPVGTSDYSVIFIDVMK